MKGFLEGTTTLFSSPVIEPHAREGLIAALSVLPTGEP
jgi:hypothetical protein